MVNPRRLFRAERHADFCADLFRRHRDEIDGVLVALPNFGDEKGVADTLKLADLDVPVLVQGYPDDLGQLGVARRRDAFLAHDPCAHLCERVDESGSRRIDADTRNSGFSATKNGVRHEIRC